MRLRLKGKKAVVEMQFNWIFVLIIGTILLGFFFGVGMWYQKNENVKLRIKVLSRLDSILVGAALSDRTTSKIDIPVSQITYICDPDSCTKFGCQSSIDFEASGNPNKYLYDVIYMPASLNTATLYFWSLEWKVPFKVGNFLYITSPDIKYVFVYDDKTNPLFKQINFLVSNLTYMTETVISKDNLSQLTYNNEVRVRFVFFYEPESRLNIRGFDGKLDLIILDGSADYGKVRFGRIDKSFNYFQTGESDYLGLPMAIGAIYSDNIGFYSCAKQKALIKLQAVNDIYARRTRILFDYYTNASKDCEWYYRPDVVDFFTQINLSAQLNTSDLSAIKSKADALVKVNNLATQYSCPALY